jgi:hypothetical protein
MTMRRTVRFAAVIQALMLLVRTGAAQGTYEIEVYSTEITPVKSLLIELHSNYTFRGSDVTVFAGGHAPVIDPDQWLRGPSNVHEGVGRCSPTGVPYLQRTADTRASFVLRNFSGVACATTLPSNAYAEHESVELVTGLTSWSEVGAYLFTSEQMSPLISAVGGSLRYKVRAPGAWKWPVNVAFSTEIEYDDPRYSTDQWTWELRPVIEKAIGRWYLSVNPTVERTLVGAGVPIGMQFSPSAKAEFDVTDRISAGIEYYSAYGKIGAFAPPASRLQQAFGVIDLHVSPLWEVNAGLGAGMTPATNHLVAKVILGRRI